MKRLKELVPWDTESLGLGPWCGEDKKAIYVDKHKSWSIEFPSVEQLAKWTAIEFHWFAFSALMAYRHNISTDEPGWQHVTIKSESTSQSIELRLPLPRPPVVDVALSLYRITDEIVSVDILGPATPVCGYLVGLMQIAVQHHQIEVGQNLKSTGDLMSKRNQSRKIEISEESILSAFRNLIGSDLCKTVKYEHVAKTLDIGDSTLRNRIKDMKIKDSVDKILKESFPS